MRHCVGLTGNCSHGGEGKGAQPNGGEEEKGADQEKQLWELKAVGRGIIYAKEYDTLISAHTT